MSASPVPGQAPPDLPGYRFLQHIGSGGNAQVYLYEQQVLGRKVAVKVLNETGMSDAASRRLIDEAKVAAGLGNHPHIVQVFDADFTPDGRPYLAMEYYPQANLSVRARRAHFPVAEVLKIGIQIGGAVETSHRSDILHRDITPQNILTGQFGAPALTDFGIATTKGADGPEGMSVPWSPPEVLYGTSAGDERSDVYSLGATLWHLLVGHSPFEQPGGDNSSYALMRRIKSDPVPRTGRGDVPDSLERLLRQAMAKEPGARQQTALDLVRALQAVEQEMRLPLTQPVLPADESPAPAEPPAADSDATSMRGGRHSASWAPDGGDGDLTRARGPRRIDPRPAAHYPPPPQHLAVTGSRGAVADPWAGFAGLAAPPRDRQIPAEPPEASTRVRPAVVRPDYTAPPAGQDPGPPARPFRSGRVVAAAGGVLLVLVAAGAVLVFRHHSGGQPGAQATQSSGTGQSGIGPDLGLPPGVPKITPARVNARQVRFTWTYAGPKPGDWFEWDEVAGGQASGRTSEHTLLVPATSHQAVCITVTVVRAATGQTSPSATRCSAA